jgi:hypothetical protein
MTVTTTATRSMRVGNETALSGAETLTSELGTMINSIIPAATDDHPVVIPAFTKANLTGLLLTCDRDALVRLRGGNSWVIDNIVTLGDLVLGTGGTFTVTGDLTAYWYPGDQIWITGCTTAGNDGLYTVIDTAVAAGVTTVEVFDRTAVINAAVVESFDTVEAGAGAACTATKVLFRSVKHDIDAGDDFTVAGPPGQLEVAEDVSWLVEYDKILIQETTTNDGIYNVTSATYTAPDTTIVLEEAVTVEVGTAAGNFCWIRDELMVRLTAGVPFMWTLDGGILNPCLEDITTLLVTNEHATLTADFQARILTVPV